MTKATYSERQKLIQELQKRRQELAKVREENKDNVPFQIGRALAYVLLFGVPLIVLLWLSGVF